MSITISSIDLTTLPAVTRDDHQTYNKVINSNAAKYFSNLILSAPHLAYDQIKARSHLHSLSLREVKYIRNYVDQKYFEEVCKFSPNERAQAKRELGLCFILATASVVAYVVLKVFAPVHLKTLENSYFYFIFKKVALLPLSTLGTKILQNLNFQRYNCEENKNAVIDMRQLIEIDLVHAECRTNAMS